jgi:hypothetical protein
MIIYVADRSGRSAPPLAAGERASRDAAHAAHARFLMSLGLNPAAPAKPRRRKSAPVVRPADLSPCAVSVGRAPALPECSDAIPDPASKRKPAGIVARPRAHVGQTPQSVLDAFDRAVASGRYRPAMIEDVYGPTRTVTIRDPRTGQRWVAL